MADIELLSLEEKSLLASGDGAWHTHAVSDIPAVMMTDGPHGLRKQVDGAEINDSAKATCFPTACAVASSWNVHNAAKVAQCIAEEAIAEKIDMVLGPGLNIKRSPLCGRNFEYFSEDPVLAGQLAAAYVNAMQSRGVGSCIKHFAVNSQETRRMTVDALVDERALREIYLSAFEYAVKYSQPYAVMASYNKINGAYATENKHLLTEILRNEWHFDGMVVSDWGASYNTPKALAAGLDLEMPEDPSGYHRKLVENAAKQDNCEALNAACNRVAKFAERCTVAKISADTSPRFDHEKVCEEVAADSAVLLKNEDNILPISAESDFCVIGGLAENPRFQGAGSSHINAFCKNFLLVLSDMGHKVRFAAGYDVGTNQVDEKLQQEAVDLAKKHKTVLFFGGLTDIAEGEGYDRKTLDIPQNQQVLLKKLSEVTSEIVFISFAGSPFAMPWLNQVKGLLHMYLGGQNVMQAAYNLIFGKVSPSGRLAETFPKKLQDTPCFNYFAQSGRFDEHRESIFVGYRYYNTFNVPVLFPFGYGLSYSAFEYSDFTISNLPKGFEISLVVKNCGKTDAAEVVQVYVDNPCGNLMRAKRELKAFSKVYLRAGESEEVHFVLCERDFFVYTDKFVAVNGTYAISVCKNVEETILSQKVTVSFGEDLSQNDKELYPDYFAPPKTSFAVSDDCFYRLLGYVPKRVAEPVRGKFTLNNTLEEMEPTVGLVRTALKHVRKLAIKYSPSKSVDDPVAQMVLSGARETPLISLMSIGGIPAKYVMFLLYHANKQRGRALKALFGKYIIE